MSIRRRNEDKIDSIWVDSSVFDDDGDKVVNVEEVEELKLTSKVLTVGFRKSYRR